MNYKIIDNFLNIKDFKNLNSFIKGEEIPWFLSIRFMKIINQ